MRRKRRVSVSLLAGVLLATVLESMPYTAAAEWEPSGGVSLHGLFGGGDFGAGVLVDIVEPIGSLRLGGVLGMAALTSDDAESSRVLMPFGVSVALNTYPVDGIGIGAQLRGGGWGGATNTGLGAGGWLAAGGFVEYAFDARVALGAGADAWFLWGHGNMALFAPFVTLLWTLEGSAAEESNAAP